MTITSTGLICGDAAENQSAHAEAIDVQRLGYLAAPESKPAMDQLRQQIPFTYFVAEALTNEDFVLIDVGAAEGLASAWRPFGNKLRGFGFEPDIGEVAQLNSNETAPNFRYIAGYVGLPDTHPFAKKRRGSRRLERCPWQRLAVQRWLDIRHAAEEDIPLPAPRRTPEELVFVEPEDPSEIIYLPEFLRAANLSSIDFLKVDVDSLDLDILHSMAGQYLDFGVLGVGVEVNFFGTGADTANTFHNIDRLLKGEGFELLDLTMRRYPMQDLPAPSLVGHPYPGDSAFGRLLQGDAFYARDICAPWHRPVADSLDAERIAKLAALFAMFGLPDCAAEVLLTFRDRLEPILNVDRGLDFLVKQAQPGVEHPLSYADYISQFEQEAYGVNEAHSRQPAAPPSLTADNVRELILNAFHIERYIVHPQAICDGTTRLSILTHPGRWAYSVEFPLDPASLDLYGALRLMLKVKVSRGVVGLGVLSATRMSLANEVFVSQSDYYSIVEIVTPPLWSCASLMVRNAAEDGVTELTLEIIGAVVADPGAVIR
jgi:hypothetical protein